MLVDRRGSTHDHGPSPSHTEPRSTCPVLMTRHTRWNSTNTDSSSNCPALPLFKDRVLDRTAVHHFTSPLSRGSLTSLCRVACPRPSPTSLDNQGHPARMQQTALSDQRSFYNPKLPFYLRLVFHLDSASQETLEALLRQCALSCWCCLPPTPSEDASPGCHWHFHKASQGTPQALHTLPPKFHLRT